MLQVYYDMEHFDCEKAGLRVESFFETQQPWVQQSVMEDNQIPLIYEL